MIPTAEEMEMSSEYDDYTSMMIAFATLHVQAALKEAGKIANAWENSGELEPKYSMLIH